MKKVRHNMQGTDFILSRFNAFFNTRYFSLEQVKNEIKRMNQDKQRVDKLLSFLESISHEDDEVVRTFIWNWYFQFYKHIPSLSKKNETKEVRVMINLLKSIERKNNNLDFSLLDCKELFNQTGILQNENLFLRPDLEAFCYDDEEEYDEDDSEFFETRQIYNETSDERKNNKEISLELGSDMNKTNLRFEVVVKKTGSLAGIIQLQDIDSIMEYSLPEGVFVLSVYFYNEYIKTSFPKEAIQRLIEAAFNDELFYYHQGLLELNEPIDLYIKKSVPVHMIYSTVNHIYQEKLFSSLNMGKNSPVPLVGRDFKKKDLPYFYLFNPKLS